MGHCENVPALLKSAQVFLLGSAYEGFPNVILEAMAAGLPVVTTPAGEASQVVAHGQSGYVTSADDPAALSTYLERLVNLPALA